MRIDVLEEAPELSELLNFLVQVLEEFKGVLPNEYLNHRDVANLKAASAVEDESAIYEVSKDR